MERLRKQKRVWRGISGHVAGGIEATSDSSNEDGNDRDHARSSREQDSQEQKDKHLLRTGQPKVWLIAAFQRLSCSLLLLM